MRLRGLAPALSALALLAVGLNAPSSAAPATVAAAKKCTPGYKPCLPPASDYDCKGGSGDGPRYTGRVVITGTDIYRLDTDGDGIGCDD